LKKELIEFKKAIEEQKLIAEELQAQAKSSKVIIDGVGTKLPSADEFNQVELTLAQIASNQATVEETMRARDELVVNKLATLESQNDALEKP
jgi:hypothetical protein